MTVVIALLVVALVGLCAWLLLTLEQMRQKLLALQLRLQSTPSLPPQPLGSGARIAIQILNPFELAARETKLAAAAAKLAPKMIERIVYERAAVMITQQMAEQGVRAEVKVHVG